MDVIRTPVRYVLRFLRSLARLVGTLFVLGLSVLPLSALLVALPAVAPNEAVLTDTVRPARSRTLRLLRRATAAFSGLVVLIALFAFAIEITSRLPLPGSGQLATLAKKVLGFAVTDFLPNDTPPEDLPRGKIWLSPAELLAREQTLARSASRPNIDLTLKAEIEKELESLRQEIEQRTPRCLKLRIMQDPTLAPILSRPLWTLLPVTLVNQWPYVSLIMYGLDLALLLMIGKVPLTYNLRYLWVRRRDTLLTSVVFIIVVALVVVLLAFVNGMYQLNEGTGVPGNVLVLSEGSTDEIFSNLGRSEVDDIEKVRVEVDTGGDTLRTVGVQMIAVGSDNKPLFGPDDRPVLLPSDAPPEVRNRARYLTSREIYFVVNQPAPVKPGQPPRRRLLQIRALENVRLAAAVHNISLYPGGSWFPDNSVVVKDDKTYLACCLGEGVAGTLAADLGRSRLEPGDVFTLGDEEWIVTGIMNTQGTTYGSEIWTGVNNTILVATGRANKYTTLVMRMADNSALASRAMATYLQERYTQAKLKAYSEPDYYRELTKSNESFLFYIVVVAVVMAVGGVFGVMNTMFASIAARIKEIGVMRILGFKRWQILIAFMLESLLIAFVGGLCGCALGSLADGLEASSQLSGGAGSGKSVVLRLVVDAPILAAGMLFTLVLGRLGGLVPALSAMRMNILESLR